ncbi:hypothetical protein U9M48_022897 [Paspalum notatum var. saurae]|uniref:Uncharacterized protein n=1 Tax=Paspalum notatum var. saurae TaxID=547442 RepID=A0AAQ3TMW5_PASNO
MVRLEREAIASRGQAWCAVLGRVGLQVSAPTQHDNMFQEWWPRAAHRVPKDMRQGFHSLVMLVAWTIWKHRNWSVFDGMQPALSISMGGLRPRLPLGRGWSKWFEGYVGVVLGFLGCLSLFQARM